MKLNIVFFILIVLLGITVSVSIAQQNENVPKTDTEVEALKKRISELEDKLQTVENVEKMELAAKLAEAQAKLIDTEFGKLKLELKDSNQQWLITWIFIFLGVLSVVGSSIGYAVWTGLKSKMDTLIATEVEKRVDEFEQSVEKVKILEPKVRILNKEHAASVLEKIRSYRPEHYPEQVMELEEQAILDVFSDETRHLEYRMKAAEVLASRESTELVSPILKCLKSYIDSDYDWNQGYRIQHMLCNLIYYIGQVKTTETYETLHRFLEQLLSENPEVKRFIITSITFSLVDANNEINKNDSLSDIRDAIPILDLRSDDKDALNGLVMLFEKYEEFEGIKDILTNGLTDNMPEVEEKCLELLQEHDPKFVREWKEEKEETNEENEENDESD